MRRVPLIAVTLVLRRFSYSFATDRLFYEHKVWSTFELRYKAVCNTKQETNRLIGHRYADSHFVLADVPASRIHEVTGEGMVDYCLTDPPYSDAIRFLDLSTLWAAWLDLPITEQDHRAELLIDTRPKGNRAEFEREFAASVESIARALKEDRWFTLVYKHRDLSLWQVIVRICEDSGLHFVNSTWQDVGIPSTRQIENPGINPRGDMYLNFRKVSRQRFETLYGQTQVLALPTRANYIEHEAERIIVAYLVSGHTKSPLVAIVRLLVRGQMGQFLLPEEQVLPVSARPSRGRGLGNRRQVLHEWGPLAGHQWGFLHGHVHTWRGHRSDHIWSRPASPQQPRIRGVPRES
jgi:hypothetical protein